MTIKIFPIRKILKFNFVLIGFLAVIGFSAYAEKGTREISGVSFDESIIVDGSRLKLETVGLLRYKKIFKVYSVALYQGEDFLVKDVLEEVPKRLELSYFRSISAADMVSAANKVLRRNETDLLLKKLNSRLEKFHSAYQDVKPKDRYALTYIPGKGIQMTLNSKPLITIRGADFARAYFAIWLGKEPVDKKLRDTLLDDIRD